MSYWAIEESVNQGNPIELYHFQAQGFSWRFTSADKHIYMAGHGEESSPVTDSYHDLYADENVYVSIPITRNDIDQTNDISKSDLEITVDRNNPLASLFILNTPETVTSLTIYRGHKLIGSADLSPDFSPDYSPEASPADDFTPAKFLSSNFIAIWKGRVVTVSFTGDEAKFNCESVFTSLKRYGLLAKFQYICRHSLYSQGAGRCNVSKEDFKHSGTITDIDGVLVTVSGAGDKSNGWYVGGYIQIGQFVHRHIIGHEGDLLKINKPLSPDIEIGADTNIYAGCNHSLETCRDKFDNLLNFGGFPYIPLVNPFSDLGNALV